MSTASTPYDRLFVALKLLAHSATQVHEYDPTNVAETYGAPVSNYVMRLLALRACAELAAKETGILLDDLLTATEAPAHIREAVQNAKRVTEENVATAHTNLLGALTPAEEKTN
jgi:hypothetical protein